MPATTATRRPLASLLCPDSPEYPRNLTRRTGIAPPTLWAGGSLHALQEPIWGLLCSVRIPGRLIVEAFEWACAVRLREGAVAGGFHSPVERECLGALLSGRIRLIVCPSHPAPAVRLPREWRAPFASGRLLILGDAAEGGRRATRRLAERRNSLVAALADVLVIPHASRGGGTERIAAAALARGQQVYTFGGPENDNLFLLGAKSWEEGYHS